MKEMDLTFYPNGNVCEPYVSIKYTSKVYDGYGYKEGYRFYFSVNDGLTKEAKDYVCGLHKMVLKEAMASREPIGDSHVNLSSNSCFDADVSNKFICYTGINITIVDYTDDHRFIKEAIRKMNSELDFKEKIEIDFED